MDNPELRELKQQRAGLVSELNRLKIALADHLIEPTAKKRRTPRRSQKEVLDDITVVEGKILLTDRQLEVTLRRFTNREIDYAARHLCEDLNRRQPETLDKFRFPIHYRVP